MSGIHEHSPLNKWIDNTRPNRQHTQGQRDFIVARLADAYLIRAEARLKQGNSAGAADDINVIRTRAAWHAAWYARYSC